MLIEMSTNSVEGPCGMVLIDNVFSEISNISVCLSHFLVNWIIIWDYPNEILTNTSNYLITGNKSHENNKNKKT